MSKFALGNVFTTFRIQRITYFMYWNSFILFSISWKCNNFKIFSNLFVYVFSLKVTICYKYTAQYTTNTMTKKNRHKSITINRKCITNKATYRASWIQCSVVKINYIYKIWQKILCTCITLIIYLFQNPEVSHSVFQNVRKNISYSRYETTMLKTSDVTKQQAKLKRSELAETLASERFSLFWFEHDYLNIIII